MKHLKTIVFSIVLLGGFLCCVLKTPGDYSVSERRKLHQFPELTLSAIKSGKFMKDFEEYALDQIPFREEFRTLKGATENYLFQKKNYNDIYVEQGYGVGMVYPMNEKSMANAVAVMESIYDSYLKETGSKVYFSMIPDKNYFLYKEAGQISMDYDKFFSYMKEQTSYMEYIDIMELLAIEDYYRTDSHWKQESIVDVADRLKSSMQKGNTQSNPLEGVKSETENESGIVDDSHGTKSYHMNRMEEDFYGVYAGRLPLPLEPDKITVLTNEVIDSYQVYDHENGREIPVYGNPDKVTRDMYETYLGGSLSLITIENPGGDSEKELILFRDSFGSSIAPLLAEDYGKVTIVDVRYIRWEILDEFLDFHGQDVLFLYSTGLLNNNEIR